MMKGTSKQSWRTSCECEQLLCACQEAHGRISRASSQAGSRAASPRPPEIFEHPPDTYANMQPSTSDHSSRTGSQYASSPRPISPGYPQQPVSPFSKPQSPPALIIPAGSASAPQPPQLPPIVTASMSKSPKPTSRSSGAGLPGASGGLFPPVNPALEHLTGMAGISPIAPGADGPMITIQPSTPISGLKESRGVFDAALRRASAQAQQQPVQAQTGQWQQPQASNGQSIAAQQAVNGTDYANWESTLLRTGGVLRPRAKSDSFTASPTEAMKQQALVQMLAAQAHAQGSAGMSMGQAMQGGMTDEQWRASIDAWRTGLAEPPEPQATVDPRIIPGQESDPILQQLTQLQAQRGRVPFLNTELQAPAKFETGVLSPITLALCQQFGITPTFPAGGTASAPYYVSTFEGAPAQQPLYNNGNLLAAQPDVGQRRRSFAEGSNHPAAGFGTPGYGVEFTRPTSPFGQMGPGPIRGSSPMGHRRAVKSEDFGRGGSASGWGVGAGGTTCVIFPYQYSSILNRSADFLQSITANDGTLLPPAGARSHSRHSSISSNRSPSPAPSDYSQGSSYSYHSGAGGHMEMPDGVHFSDVYNEDGTPKVVAKMKVTSMATEVASSSRRSNAGVFQCPGQSRLPQRWLR